MQSFSIPSSRRMTFFSYMNTTAAGCRQAAVHVASSLPSMWESGICAPDRLGLPRLQRLIVYLLHCVPPQLGGRDQWGNITAGCDYIRKATGSIVHGELTKMSPWCHHDATNKSSFLYLITVLISSNLLLLSNPFGWDEARVKWPGIRHALSFFLHLYSLCFSL